jgi:hypothetical protein
MVDVDLNSMESRFIVSIQIVVALDMVSVVFQVYIVRLQIVFLRLVDVNKVVLLRGRN